MAIAIIAGAKQGNISIEGVSLDTMLAIDPLKGSVHPPLIQGRAPRADDEIVLGSATLRKLHRHVGQTVDLDVGPPVGRLTLHIVGRMISPSVGDLFTNRLGDGGWIFGPAVRHIAAQTPAAENGPPPSAFNLFAVRYAAGAQPSAALASLRRDFGPTVLRQLPPEDVVNLDSVANLPFILSGLVVLIGLATVGHALATSIRQRRRDLAILKAIGFMRLQVVSDRRVASDILHGRGSGRWAAAGCRGGSLGVEPTGVGNRLAVTTARAGRRRRSRHPLHGRAGEHRRRGPRLVGGAARSRRRIAQRVMAF